MNQYSPQKDSRLTQLTNIGIKYKNSVFQKKKIEMGNAVWNFNTSNISSCTAKQASKQNSRIVMS